MEICKELLKRELQDGKWHDVEEIRKLIKGAGIKQNIFKQARKELGIVTRNNGNGTWSWRMIKDE